MSRPTYKEALEAIADGEGDPQVIARQTLEYGHSPASATAGVMARPTCPTENAECSNAELCRRNGWEPGTVVVGDEGYGPTRLLITGIGEKAILGRALGRPQAHEKMWTLKMRDWRKEEHPVQEDRMPLEMKDLLKDLVAADEAAWESQGAFNKRIHELTERARQILRAA